VNLPTSTTLGQVILVAFLSAILTTYWTHCIVPAQRMVGALSRTLRVIQGVGVLLGAAFVLAAALKVDGRPVPPFIVAASLALGVWYLAAWPRPELIARVSGGFDPRERLRQSLWYLNSSTRRLLDDAGSDQARNQFHDAVGRLRKIPRTPDTAPLIDLWLAHADAIVADGSAGIDRPRTRAMYAEAGRLWPDVTLGRVAAPFGPGSTNWPDDDDGAEPSGSDPSLEPLRILLWQISSDSRDVEDDVAGSPARADLERELVKLRAMPTTASTEPLINLWVAEGEAALRGQDDVAQRDVRRRAIWAEARRLWPDFSTGRVVAPAIAGPRDWPGVGEPGG
jgi:hypothetical protein